MLVAVLLAPLIALFQTAPSANPVAPFAPSPGSALEAALSSGLPSATAFEPAAAPDSGPGFQARLSFAQTSVQPGGEADLAIELRFAPGWKIYHPLILDTGLPTEVEFELPKGVTVGELRFPAPTWSTIAEGELKQEFLGLESPVVMLTKVRVAPDTPAGPLTLKATASALACKGLCVPAEAEATAVLPVLTDPPAPANQQLFEDARRNLPQQFSEADNIAGSRVLAAHTQLPVGERGTIVAAVRVKSGHHIQDRDPGVEGLIPSRLYIEHVGGLKFLDQVWPQPYVKEYPELGKVRELGGDFVIQAPFEVEQDFEPKKLRLRALFEYQVCADTGICFPSNLAEGYIEFEVVPAGAPAVASTDPILAKLGEVGEASPAASPSRAGTTAIPPNLLWVFLAAFAGGAILNVMPCVLPVISLKIFGFVQQAHEQRGRIFRMGLAYTAGIMASFLLLAILMVYAGLAWGGLMQRPEFLIGLVAVVFAFALSLLGVYEISLPGRITSAAGEAAARGGYVGAFMNGILTTLLATSCVAPLLGTAIGVLMQLPNPYLAGAGIMVVGAGLATPYLLLTAFPSWLRFLPKPGPWMVTFKQVVGFLLIAVVVWLLSILMKMIDHAMLQGTLGLICAIGFGCWLIGRIRLSDGTGRWAAHWSLALLFAGGGGFLSFWVFSPRVERIPWQEWKPGMAQRLAAEGNTVFLDYTAEWCPNCKTIEAVVLNSQEVAAQFAKFGVYPIRVDFTTKDSEIQEELRQHGRSGVPTYVMIPAYKPNEPIVLPEMPSGETVLEALRQAGPSKQRPEFWSTPPNTQPTEAVCR
jgi:thiol:disulfide interchange protein